MFQSYNSLNDLEPFVKAFFKIYLDACSQLLATEDKKWEIFRRVGHSVLKHIVHQLFGRRTSYYDV